MPNGEKDDDAELLPVGKFVEAGAPYPCEFVLGKADAEPISVLLNVPDPGAVLLKNRGGGDDIE